MFIREATAPDLNAIRDIHLQAFPEEENQLVSKLAVELLSEKSIPKTISLVAEVDDAFVGHIAFSPVVIHDDTGRLGYLLGPLAVAPELQRRGIGSELVESGIRRVKEMGAHVLFVYGDPKYYGRFGFTDEQAAGYTPPYVLEYPFGWLAMVFGEGPSAEAPVRLSCVGPLNDPKLW